LHFHHLLENVVVTIFVIAIDVFGHLGHLLLQSGLALATLSELDREAGKKTRKRETMSE
jgi:hypothetical protein